MIWPRGKNAPKKPYWVGRPKCSCGRNLYVKTVSSYCTLWEWTHRLERRGLVHVRMSTSTLVRVLDMAGVITALNPEDRSHTTQDGRWVPAWCIPRHSLTDWCSTSRWTRTTLSLNQMATIFRNASEDPSLRPRLYDAMDGASLIYDIARSEP